MSKVHEDNAGYVGVSYEETQDPFFSYNKLALPLGQSKRTTTPGEGTFVVTVSNVNGANKYFLDGVQQATVTLLEGNIYTFDQSDASNGTHPLKFSYTADGTWGGGSEYTTGVTTNGTPGQVGAYTRIVVPYGLHDLKYYCGAHSGMGGSIAVTVNPHTFSGGLPIRKTTDQYGKTVGTGYYDDPLASYLVLAAPMSGGDFSDVHATVKGSGSNKSVDNSGVTQATESKLYGTSGEFLGGTDHLQFYGAARDNTADFAFAAGEDFTVEAWIWWDDDNQSGSTGSIVADYYEGSSNTSPNWQFVRRATRTFGLWWNNAGTTVSLSAPTKCLQNKTWHHVAIQRRYATFDLVLDGKVVSSYTAYGYQNAIGRGRSMWVGIDADENAEDFCGYMQDLRIYKGIAKYAVPFLPASYGMDIVTWDGNGGSQQIRNLNFKPDLVWIKNINGGHNHMLYDAIRGAGNELMTNGTQSQNQGGSSDLTSFEEGGFNLGSNNAVNQSGRNYLAWCWKAKGTGSSVSAGALTTSAYNKDQTWSTYGSFTGSTWNPAIGTLFNGNPSNGPSLLAGNTGTWTFTQPITASSSIKINCVNGSGPLGSTITSGTEIRLTVDGVTHAISGRPGLIDTGLTGNLEAITIHVTSGSGSPGLRYVLVDGKELLDSGTTSPTTPSQNATVSASEEFGFSVVQYAGSSSAISVAHGLPSAPDFMLVKKYNASGDQFVAFHVDVGNEHALRLNDAPADSGYDWWGSVSPNDKVFTVGTTGATNSGSGQYIAYCWCNRPGYSKFGRFTGLCSSSYTQELGFKPKFVMIRRVGQGSGGETTYGGWGMYQEPYTSQQLMANCSGEEGVRGNCAVGSNKRDIQANVVFTDTGFTVSSCWFEQNDTVDYVYAAWAESAPGAEEIDHIIVDELNTEDSSGNKNNASSKGAEWQTGVEKFYGGALKLTEDPDRLTIDTSSNEDLKFGIGDFTVEAWCLQTTSVTYPSLFEIGNHLSTAGVVFIIGPSTRIYSDGFYGSGSMTLNDWNHVAFCRKNGVLEIYINGAKTSSVAFTNNLTDVSEATIGNAKGFLNGSYQLRGYIQDLRAYKGIAKYTSDFTPPERSVEGTARRYPSGIYVVS